MITDKTITTDSPEETFQFAASLAREAEPGDTLALYGDLGTGKTVFAKGFAHGLNITEEITRPTFNLMEVYQGRLPFYHFDLYRIETPGELDNLFFEEYWEGKGASLTEWAERAEGRLPAGTAAVTLTYLDENRRRITIEHSDT